MVNPPFSLAENLLQFTPSETSPSNPKQPHIAIISAPALFQALQLSGSKIFALLSLKEKELILKALIQSRALYLAMANEMPKSIAQRMTKQMKSFTWENKRPLMNWMDATQPNENGGLGLPDIEARLEAIQVMWLKKYLAPLTERPIWAFVTDQIVFKYTQKTPAVNDRNKINWVLQTWDITNTKERKIPDYIKEMLKNGRKYNIGYDTIVAGKDQRRKMPLWHHVGVLDNYSWNKKLASCLRLTHKIRTVGDLEDYMAKDS